MKIIGALLVDYPIFPYPLKVTKGGCLSKFTFSDTLASDQIYKALDLDAWGLFGEISFLGF